MTPILLRAEWTDLRLEGSGFSLRVPTGRVALKGKTLVAGRLLLRSVELDSPQLKLHPASAGEEAVESVPAPALPPVQIESLAIRDGQVGWSDPQRGSLEIGGIRASGPIGTGSLEIEAPRGTWRGETSVGFGPARARLAVTSGLDATLDSLQLEIGSSRLSARGPLLRRATFAPALDIDAHVDLTDQGRRLDAEELAGSLSMSGHLEAVAAAVTLVLRATGEAGWGEWHAEDLEADARLVSAPLSAELRLRGRALGASVEGEAWIAGNETRGRLQARDLDLTRLPRGLRPDLGRARADAELAWNGPIDGPLHLEISVDGATRGARGTARVQAEARGTLQPQARSVDVTWTARVDAAAGAHASVELQANGLARGPLPPAVSGTLSGSGAFTRGERAFEAAFHGTFGVEGDEVRARLEAKGPAGSLEIEGVAVGERLVRSSLHGERLDLALIAPGATGTTNAELEASGPLGRPSLSGRLAVEDLTWQGASLGRLEAHLGGDLHRVEIEAGLPDLSIESAGTLALGPDRRLRGHTRFEMTPLAPLFSLVRGAESLEGRVTATVSHDVPLDRPADAEVTVEVAALDVERGGQSLRARPFFLSLREGHLALENVQIEGPDGARLRARGVAGLEARDPLEIDVTVTGDLASLPVPQGWSVVGAAEADLEVRGSRGDPVLSGVLRGEGVSLRRASLPEIGIDEAEVILADDRLMVQGAMIRVGEGRATLEAEVPLASLLPALRTGDLAPSEEALLSLRWEGVSLDPIEGSLSGELTVEGGLASLTEPRAALFLPGARLRLEGIPVSLAPATLHLEGGRLTTDRLEIGTGAGELVLSGEADLVEKLLDLRGQGTLILGVLSPLLKEAAVGGSAEVDLHLSGPLDSPRPSGRVQVEGGSLRLRALPQAVTGLRGRVDIDGTLARLEATGQLGGGGLQLTGEALASEWALGDLWLQLTGRDIALGYPPGLRSGLDVDLTLAGRPGDLRLAGDVEVQRGLYEIDTAVREALRAPAPASAESSLLRTISLDVGVELVRPVAVRSGFGRLEATGRITARGDLQEPAPFGRLDVRRGGVLSLQGREFTVTDGALNYSGDWNAEALLRAEAVIRGEGENEGSTRDYRVRLSLEGLIDQPRLELVSEPNLSRQEIVSLIATGRLRSPLVDASAWLVGGQAASLIAGGLTGRVARTFGLDELTVRPDLVALDTDPSARFTFAKRFGPSLKAIYSAGLGGPETRFAEVEGRPGFDTALRAQRTDAGSHTFGAGQRFEWGGVSPEDASSEVQVRLEGVRFEGSGASDSELRDAIRLSVGRRVAEWRIQEEAERLRARLRRQGHLDAEVGARLEEGVAIFSVEPGPLYGWRVEGLANPPDLDPILREALFEVDALDLGGERVLRALHARGHLRAVVQATARDEGDRRWLVFSVEPGPRYAPVDVRFPGARALARRTLLDAAGGAAGLLEHPEAAVEALLEAYRARSFLSARVADPQVEVEGSALTIVVAIEEGPPARLSSLRFEGASLPEEDLRSVAGLTTGVPFSGVAVGEAVSRVRNLYLSEGYPDVRVHPELVPEGGDLALLLKVREGERHHVEEIAISGNSRTRDTLVRRTLRLEKGDPVDPQRLAAAERRLLNLGVFSRVAVAPRRGAPASLLVDLEEGANFGAGYDLRWDDDEGASALVTGEARNLLGLGLALGGRYRYGADLREVRGSFFVPAPFVGGDIIASAFRTWEDRSSGGLELIRVQKGFQVQQSLRLPNRWELLAGYRFRRSTFFAEDFVPEPIDLAGLDLSLFRNTRDDLLDPVRGRFWSLNVNVDPRILGSDVPYLKAFGQAIFARSFAGDALTWAQGYSLGLAWGFEGSPVSPYERFFAGGAASLRGFGTKEVGPRDPWGEPIGGEAVVILNQELRYRHSSGLGAAVFYDGGNVFARVRDMRLELRHTLGAGLRWASPIGLLRVDIGFPLDRRPEEKSYRLFFGLGQAF